METGARATGGSSWTASNGEAEGVGGRQVAGVGVGAGRPRGGGGKTPQPPPYAPCGGVATGGAGGPSGTRGSC